MIKSVITLKDQYTKTAMKVAKSAEQMGGSLKKSSKDADKLTSSLKQLTRRKYQIKLDDIKDKKVKKQINDLQNNLKRATGKDYQIKITARKSLKELAKSNIDLLKNKAIHIRTNITGLIKARIEAHRLAKELGRTTGKKHTVRMFLSKSGESGGGGSSVAGVAGMLKSGAAVAAVAAVAAAAAAVAGGTMLVKSMLTHGSELEQQQISMKHFLGGDQAKADAYMKELRENANKTPFGTGEVVAAGTRAVQITEGDTKKGMELVKLAEDMAALNPGKTISDAMEALADAKMGEMERLKEFGFKGSKELFDAAGGDLFRMKSASGKSLLEMYQGGAAKLAGSHKGKISTIMGNIQSGLADSGLKLIEALAPTLDKLIPVSERLAKKLPEVTDAVIKHAVPVFKIIGTVTKNYVIPALQYLGTAISTVVSTIQSAVGGVKSIVSNVKEKFSVSKPTSKFATGTSSFKGGWATVNERGDEMFKLPDRTKIYPSSKTDAAISRELRLQEQKAPKNAINITFNIHTSGEIDEQKLGKIVGREMEKILINM